MFKLKMGFIFEFKNVHKYLNVKPKKLISQTFSFNFGEPTNIDSA